MLGPPVLHVFRRTLPNRVSSHLPPWMTMTESSVSSSTETLPTTSQADDLFYAWGLVTIEVSQTKPITNLMLVTESNAVHRSKELLFELLLKSLTHAITSKTSLHRGQTTM